MKLHTPAISIIVPVFNAENFLPSVFACLQQQTFDNFEVVCVDDGSSDSSAELIRQVAGQDERFRLVQQANAGVSAARNRGLDVARGEWIAFVDSDDWLRPDALAVWLHTAEKHQIVHRESVDGMAQPEVVMVNGFRFHATPDNVVEASVLQDQPWGRCVSGSAWVVHAVGSGTWKHYVWLQMIRRAFAEKECMRFAVNMIHEDILWTCELALRAQRIAFCDERVYGYRVNPQSLTCSPAQAQLLERARGYATVLSFLVSKAQGQTPELQRALLQQGIVEAGHLMGLFRKRLERSTDAIQLADNLLTSGVLTVLRRAVTGPSDWWRLMRLQSAVRAFAKA